MGTPLLCIIISLFLAGLGLQTIIFCGRWSPISMFLRVVDWLVFSIPCLWASMGACCWLILLRDLGEAGMRKRLLIKETALIYGICFVLVAPFAFIMFVVAQESVELGEGLRMDDTTEMREGSGSRGEETMRLVGGIEK
jgi:hypothetical protein